MTEAAAKSTTVLLFRVDAVERRSERIWLSGTGADARFEDVDLGWFVRSGRVCFSVGPEHPGWSVGDVLELRRHPS